MREKNCPHSVMSLQEGSAAEALLKLEKHPGIEAFYAASLKLDRFYVARAATAIRRDFVWLSYRRHENTEMHNLVLYNLLCVYDGLARYLDCQGFNKLVPFELFMDFPFQKASLCMSVENELLMEAGMHPADVRRYWEIVEEHKTQVLRNCAEGFCFQTFTLPMHLGYLGPRDGNSWLDRLVAGVAGVAAVGLNIAGATAGTVATCGFGAPLAGALVAASVTAGVVGIGQATTGGMTP